ncbi:hypothetical protein M196_gp38 [Halorubrum tailed virus 4]|uniref:Uncharacterized protein n=1 Tax=Halorubrum tailed virus 4 TaxID=1273752 RepID=R4T8D3_9CAUD|nr:hypothetical protein M196_gp38 [Halorubrum tailed virus 4]AGM11130.1 hypothetical protein HRTV4_38 [Halorubrum tailed virus 4]
MSTQGEHTFEVETLISGEEIRSYTAGEALTAGEPVGLSGDYTVSASAAGEGDFLGVAAYDVASGEEVPVLGDDCEVRVEVSEAVTAGEELLPDGLGTFESVATSAGSSGVAIVQDGASSGELCEAYIYAIQGATA